jgi:hypothetical protein
MRRDRGTRLVVGDAACEFVTVSGCKRTVSVRDQAGGRKHFASESLKRLGKRGWSDTA